MPGFLLNQLSTVLCAHGGQAQATAPVPRVLVGGLPAVTLAAPYILAGCAFVPPAGNGPCVTAQWLMGATRVLAMGMPVLLMDSQAICTPTGTPLVVVQTQVRVRGT